MTWELYGPGRVTVCVDENDADFNAAGKTGGEKAHKDTVDEMPMHTHSTERAPIRWSEVVDGSMCFYTTDNVGTAVYAESTSTGGNQPHNNLQPYITSYRWVRVS